MANRERIEDEANDALYHVEEFRVLANQYLDKVDKANLDQVYWLLKQFADGGFDNG